MATEEQIKYELVYRGTVRVKQTEGVVFVICETLNTHLCSVYEIREGTDHYNVWDSFFFPRVRRGGGQI